MNPVLHSKKWAKFESKGGIFDASERALHMGEAMQGVEALLQVIQ